MSNVISLYHVVIGTKMRLSTITPNHAEHVNRYISKYLEEHKCKLLAVNGMPDHIHFLFDLHPTEALSRVMQDLKTKLSIWMKNEDAFPLFDGWCSGYYASSVSPTHKDAVIDYIHGQHEHHTKRNYIDEMHFLCIRNCIKWHPDDLM